MAFSPPCGSEIGFEGRQGDGKVWALEGDLGLGRKAGLATSLKPGQGAGRVRYCTLSEPGLHHYSRD